MEIKNISSINLKYISSRKKTYEGRLNTGFWASLKIGDSFILKDEDGKSVCVKVSGLKYFNNFGDAWFVLGERLIPHEICQTIHQRDAVNFYRTYYKDEDVREYGVIAVALTIV